MRTARCNNVRDFRSKARRRIPAPIFHYIDGAADDEVTYRRNTEAYERCDSLGATPVEKGSRFWQQLREALVDLLPGDER